MAKLWRDKEWLRQKYEKERLGAPEIARIVSCSKSTILYWLDKHGIERRSNSEAHVGIPNLNKTMLDADTEHNLITAYESGESGQILAEELNLSNQVVYRILHEYGVVRPSNAERYTLDEYAFDVIDNEGAAYWLGFIYADGCVYRNALRVMIKASDGHHLEKLARFLVSDRPVSYCKRKQYHNTYKGEDYALVTFGNRHLASRLTRLGIVKDRPSMELVATSVPPSLAHHWIRGYFDGDGSAGRNRHRIRFIGQRHVLEWIDAVIIAELGLAPRNLGRSKCMFTSYYGGAFNCRKLTAFLYRDATVWLERKRKLIDAWPPPKTPGRDPVTGQFTDG